MTVKKILSIVLIAAVAGFLFTGASPWEGAAAIAPDGELPASGRFVATNSFPRNTVVDITNIETGKSTRVIVAGGLDNPGLLGTVSREAAEIIGMRSGSVSRIRMTQPSDPVAYYRFTEGLSQGIPDYDSGDIITEENYAAREPVEPIRIGQAPAEEPQSRPSVTTSTGLPGYFLEPEWTGGKSSRNIVDLPEPAAVAVQEEPSDPALTVSPEEPVEVAEAEETVEEEPEYVAEVPEEEPAGEEPVEIAEVPEEEVLDPPVEVAEEIEEFDWYAYDDDYDEPEMAVASGMFYGGEVFDDWEPEVAEAFPEETYEFEDYEVYDWEPIENLAALFPPEEEFTEFEYEDDTPAVEEIAEEPPADFNIVEADERPPANSLYGIDPSDIIPGITRATEENIDETPSLMGPFIDSLDENRVTSGSRAEPSFSVQRIYELNRGSYYVQVASYEAAEMVENAVSSIDSHYEPKVYKDGDQSYRVLLGPLNQGESAAMLARFKSIGYKDAFVRVAR
jgi:hypothetical protein